MTRLRAVEGLRQVARLHAARGWVARVLPALAALAIVLGGGAGVSAQERQADSLHAEIASIEDGSYPNARMIVTVEDTGGEAPAALDVSSFSVTVNAAPAAIASAELARSEDAPLYVLFVIDTSGSMGGEAIAAAKAAAHAFVAELNAADYVGVTGFGNAVTLVQDFTTDRALIDGAIDGLTADGNTALYQATADAAAIISAAPSARRAVVLLSDGADFGGRSVATREESLAAAAGSGVPYFVIAQGADLDRAYLQELASASRGRYLTAPTPAELDALYVGIGRLLRSQYVITFDASAASPESAATVSVTVTDGVRTSAASEMPYTPGPDFAPQATLTGVQDGESIDAPRELVLSISAGSPHVAWYIDDVNVAEQDAPPYVLSYDPAQFAEGAHTLKVRIGTGATPFEQSVTFSSTPPAFAAGGGAPIVLIACVVAGIVAAIGSVLWFRSRSGGKERGISPDQRTTSWAEQIARKAATAEGAEPMLAPGDPEQEDIGEPLGLLVSRAGNDAGREYSVGGKPVSIGAGAQCGVRIDDPELSFEEAWMWVRGDHLVLHKKTRLSRLEALGEVGGWQMLEPGDTFQIGGHMFEFRLLPSEAAETPPSTQANEVPNILRDREPGDGAPRPPRPFSDLMPRSE